MICPFCKAHHDNDGDRYGCPNCNGEGLKIKPKESKDYVKKHRDLAAKSGLKRVEATIHSSRVSDFRAMVAEMRQPVVADPVKERSG